MTRRRWIQAAVVVAVPVLAFGWWLGSPLLFDKEVSEEFPMSADADIPDDMTQEEVEAEMEKAAAEDVVAVVDEMPAEEAPSVLNSGQFRDFDSFHQGSGNVTIYELEDKSRVLRLEGFEVTNGPDLHVLLVPNANPQSSDDVTGYVDLGSLKGNVGDQNYDIPPDAEISEYGSVVIYCQPFHVIFSIATLDG